MGLLSLFRRTPAAVSSAAPPRAEGASGQVFNGLQDPMLLEFIRSGGVSAQSALKNPAVFRAVDLISGIMGALPLSLMRKKEDGRIEVASEHPLHRALAFKPNGWQSPFQFKSLMQFWALYYGNAYAFKVTSLGRVVALNPIHPKRVTVKQGDDFSLSYCIHRKDGSSRDYDSAEIFHLRGPSDDGITGLSRVEQAADVISIAIKSSRAVERIFENGMMVGGNLSHPSKLSDAAYKRLRDSMEERFAGAENAGRWIITEEGMTASPFAQTAVDAQLQELRAATVEDIGRLFGVPRPLLGVDDTSWGSGIEQLAHLFVRFGLTPWFKAWEDSLAVSCLNNSELGVLYADFDEHELLRGTIKDQFEAYAKAAGAGGHKPWMESNEIRAATGMGAHKDGYGLTSAPELKKP